MFIRTKKIKGNSYAYLVENIWENNRSRQKVKEYLGRTITPVKQKSNTGEILSDFKKSILNLINSELEGHGFLLQGKVLARGTVVAKPEKLEFKLGKKPVVIKINDGYLCKNTLEPLLDFKIEDSKKKTGRKLAKLLVHAGIEVSTEQFIKLFELIKIEEKEEEEDKPTEIYY